MLQSSIIKQPGIAASHANLVAAYFQHRKESYMISVADQKAVLQRTDHLLLREQICFVIDFSNNKITWHKGIRHWLNYTEASFSIRDYNEILHPSHSVIQGLYSTALLEMLLHKKMQPVFMHPICKIILGIKHKSGKYVYCKSEIYPFQLTEENIMTEYFCQLSIIKDFDEEKYHFRLLPGQEQSYTNEKLAAVVRKKFTEHTNFSMQELRILTRYAQKKQTTSKMVGNSFKIKESTVNTFNKRIIKKAEDFLQIKFSSAKETADYLRKAGLI
jgi:hypothetical protein